MATVLMDFWHWWIGAIRDALLHILPVINHDDKTIAVDIGAGSFVVLRDGNRTHANETEPFPIQQLAARLSSMFGNYDIGRSKLIVRLLAGQFVLRQLSAFALPSSKIKAAAELDLAIATPFRRDDVHILIVEPHETGSAYAVVNKSVLDPIFDLLRSKNLTIKHLEFETQTELRRLETFELSKIKARNDGLSRLLIKASCVGLTIALIATVAHLWLRNQRSLEALSTSVERLTTDAKLVRQVLDKRNQAQQTLLTLRQNFEDSQSVTAVWEELARVLPDSAYLTDLEVKEQNVAISGYATEATALVVALEQSALFSNASFTAPVVKSPGQNGERFQISLETNGAD